VWNPDRAEHLPPDRRERVIVSWGRLRLIDKYETDFGRQRKTINFGRTNADRTKGEHQFDPVDPDSEDPTRLSDLDREEIGMLIDRLPERSRIVVRALLYEGKTQAEIAKELGVSQPAISATFDKARNELRELMLPYVETK